MGNVLHADFNVKKVERAYSADVYSFDMEKYCFEVITTCIMEAYHAFVKESVRHGVKVIRCIAIYPGLIDQRGKQQLPVRVWQQYDSVAGSLVEYL